MCQAPDIVLGAGTTRGLKLKKRDILTFEHYFSYIFRKYAQYAILQLPENFLV